MKLFDFYGKWMVLAEISLKLIFLLKRKESGAPLLAVQKHFMAPMVVKFPHSPILHYAFSSWIKKAMALSLGKQICFTIEWGCAEILPQWFAYEPSLLQVYVRKHVFLLSI